MIDINLLPEHILKRRQRALAATLRTLAIVIICAALAGEAGLKYAELRQLRAEAAALDEEAGTYRGLVALKKGVDDTALRVEEQRKLEAARRGQVLWSEALQDIGLGTPTTVALERVEAGDDGSLVVTGLATDLAALAGFLDGLHWHRYRVTHFAEAARDIDEHPLPPFAFTVELSGWQGGG